MRKIKFDQNFKAHLDEPLNVGDIIEVTDRYGIKSALMVCIDEDNSTSCSECVFNTNGGSVCEEMIRTSFAEYGRVLSPCSALLLNNGKGYRFMHCLYYKNMDPVLEGL